MNTDDQLPESVYAGTGCKVCGARLKVIATDPTKSGMLNNRRVVASQYDCGAGHRHKDVLVGDPTRLMSVDLYRIDE